MSAARPSRTVRRMPTPEPVHGLPTEIQRNRLLSAAIRSLDEVGYANASVAHITSRARVSRRTFYELFTDREQCLLAAFEDVLGLIERELVAAQLEDLPWRDRVRLGLWAILSFFEREPAIARLCVVQSLQGDAQLLARRAALLDVLAQFLDAGRDESAKDAQATPLTAEGLVGAALTIIYTRLLREDSEPLTELLGELMSLIVLPYLGSTAARRELSRPLPGPRPHLMSTPAPRSASPTTPLRASRCVSPTARCACSNASPPSRTPATAASGRWPKFTTRARSQSCSRAWSASACSPIRARRVPRARRMPGV